MDCDGNEIVNCKYADEEFGICCENTGCELPLVYNESSYLGIKDPWELDTHKLSMRLKLVDEERSSVKKRENVEKKLFPIKIDTFENETVTYERLLAEQLSKSNPYKTKGDKIKNNNSNINEFGKDLWLYKKVEGVDGQQEKWVCKNANTGMKIIFGTNFVVNINLIPQGIAAKIKEPPSKATISDPFYKILSENSLLSLTTDDISERKRRPLPDLTIFNEPLIKEKDLFRDAIESAKRKHKAKEAEKQKRKHTQTDDKKSRSIDKINEIGGKRFCHDVLKPKPKIHGRINIEEAASKKGYEEKGELNTAIINKNAKIKKLPSKATISDPFYKIFSENSLTDKIPERKERPLPDITIFDEPLIVEKDLSQDAIESSKKKHKAKEELKKKRKHTQPDDKKSRSIDKINEVGGKRFCEDALKPRPRPIPKIHGNVNVENAASKKPASNENGDKRFCQEVLKPRPRPIPKIHGNVNVENAASKKPVSNEKGDKRFCQDVLKPRPIPKIHGNVNVENAASKKPASNENGDKRFCQDVLKPRPIPKIHGNVNVEETPSKKPVSNENGGKRFCQDVLKPKPKIHRSENAEDSAPKNGYEEKGKLDATIINKNEENQVNGFSVDVVSKSERIFSVDHNQFNYDALDYEDEGDEIELDIHPDEDDFSLVDNYQPAALSTGVRFRKLY